MRDVLPELDACECGLLLASIGSADTGAKFAALTGAPHDQLAT